MRAGHDLVMVLPEEERVRFLGALEADSGAPQDALAHVDVSTAESFDPTDKERIMGQVEEVGGAAKVNEVVIAALNDALADLAAKAAEEEGALVGEVGLNTALYLRALGRYPEARALAERVAAARAAAEAAGEGDAAATLEARGLVGNIMEDQGELEAARAATSASARFSAAMTTSFTLAAPPTSSTCPMIRSLSAGSNDSAVLTSTRASAS